MRFGLWCLTATVMFALVVSATAQQPRGGEKKGPDDNRKGGPPRFVLGSVLPHFVRDELELTAEQEKQIADLEKEVREKLTKILTAEQRRKADSARPKGPPNDEGKKGPPDDNGKKGPPDGKDRPATEAPADLPMPRLKDDKNLLKNGQLARVDAASNPESFTLKGNVQWMSATHRRDFSPCAVALQSNKDSNPRSGGLYQDVVEFEGGLKRWFRFSCRGLPENNFAVTNDALFLKVDFFGNKGTNYLESITQKIYPQVERDRKELKANGNNARDGAAVWRTYALDFKLPFAEIDMLRVGVYFENGVAASNTEAAFFVSDLALVPIPNPADLLQAVKKEKGVEPLRANLVHLGGRWYYEPKSGKKERPARLKIDASNARQLFYLDNKMANPFAENMSAWLRKGYLDINGKLVEADRFVPDNVVIEFADDKTMIVRARNIPNHPTGQFPEQGGRKGNPSYIQEHAYTYYLPLEPTRNPKAVAMNKTNSNWALPMGSTAIATNGVVFYNPFDAGNMDATNIMDRCCGHPSPDNRYHYHKYPICVKSPFGDEGEEHSPLIGFAFDGFPIYGPYESKRLMAKDCKENPLNEFNIHFDEVRGWHYHVTPGQYPYVIGGYWGEWDGRNFERKSGPKR